MFPIVYAVAGAERCFPICLPGVRGECGRSLRRGKTTEGRTPSQRGAHCVRGIFFYFTCIDEREKLLPLYEKNTGSNTIVCSGGSVHREQWLEIMPKAASKASAALWLKSSLGCGRLVVFGDGKNDVDLFEAADEAYAVANAADVLKAVATGVIGKRRGRRRPVVRRARACAAQTRAGAGSPRRRKRQGVLPKHSVSGGIILWWKKNLPPAVDAGAPRAYSIEKKICVKTRVVHGVCTVDVGEEPVYVRSQKYCTHSENAWPRCCAPSPY